MFKKSNIRRWNPTAVECYNRGCICEGCQIYECYFKNTDEKCSMRDAVKELVRIIGKPIKYKTYRIDRIEK